MYLFGTRPFDSYTKMFECLTVRFGHIRSFTMYSCVYIAASSGSPDIGEFIVFSSAHIVVKSESRI